MKNVFVYQTEQFLPIRLQEAWLFFSSAKNLALITPPKLNFKILSELDCEDIYEGMIIKYRITPLFGIPLRWHTEICDVTPIETFTDQQTKGPYRSWVHTHSFIETAGGVVMKDKVTYRLPFGVIGRIMHSLIVQRKIEAIFAYRKKELSHRFVADR